MHSNQPVAALVVGCAGPGPADAPGRVDMGTFGSAQDAEGGTGLSGSQLWAQNCMGCHNDRAPESYSDAQWEVAMLHMRVQARLTADEHRAILEFLKAAN